MLRAWCVTAALASALAPTPTTTPAMTPASGGLAQSRNQPFGRPADAWCADGWNGDRATHCEVRESTIPAVSPLDIDARPNGGIHIRGWDRSDVLVRARIIGSADTEADARRIASGVRIATAGGGIHADGPDTGGHDHWSVSFEVQVPHTAALTLNTVNGGISIADFRGAAEFRARNGGVTLSNVGGDIRGETANGGLNIDLHGDRWDGAGLDVRTHNGGIRLVLPEHYSAELETGTTNGRVNIDFPVTVQGNIGGRHLTTILGAGGAKVRAITTNGGVTIRQRQ